MKGILMKPEGIQATAERRKTNTRRVEAGLREINKEPDKWEWNSWQESQMWCRHFDSFWFDHINLTHQPRRLEVKPHYQVGETVYIKEAYHLLGVYQLNHISFDEKANIKYSLDNSVVWVNKPRTKLIDAPLKNGYHSPMMMPAWAARYFILIKDVRAERLQEITSYSIEREGLPYKITRNDEAKENYDSEIALEWFRNLWNSINKDYPWESNPFVFRYEFELKEKEK